MIYQSEGKLNSIDQMNSTGLTTHGPGFRFVDRFERLTPTSGQGWKYLDESEPFFAAHFPGRPLMPAVLLVECAAQTGGILLMEGRNVSGEPLFLASIDQFRIIAPVVPRQTVLTVVTIVKDFGALVQFDTESLVLDKIVARGRLTLSRNLASPML